MLRRRYLGLIALAFVVVLGGMAAARSAPGLDAHHSVAGSHGGWMARDANLKHPWMYATSGRDGSEIAIFDLAKFGTPQIGRIKQDLNPNGMALDASGTLYVANNDGYKGGGDVTVFPPRATTPSLTLTQGLRAPNFVAVDGSGNVWVSDIGSPPSIVVFPPGQTTPSHVITGGLIQRPSGLLFDAAQNLYIADNNTGVLEVPAGSYQPEALNLQGLSDATGIVIDPTTGNLFVSSAGSAKTLVYKPGDVNPIRQLRTSVPACVLGTGAIGRRQYIFVPDCNKSGVWVIRHDAETPTGVLLIGAPGNPPGASSVAFKAAGVP